MDFRLNKELNRWIKKLALLKDGLDIISLAGASKDLIDGSKEIKDNFLRHIAASVNLHKVERVFILHHSDCGAYKQSYKFNSPQEEKRKQIEDIKKSKLIIQKKYPKLEIVLVWGQLKDKEGKAIEFEII